MAGNAEIGKMGEDLAAAYYAQRGFVILERNWRYRRLEVDLIAARDNRLHIVEVKTRRSAAYGRPEESVDRRKMRHLLQASGCYQGLHPGWKQVQFDILSIVLRDPGPPEYFLLEDVYL